MTTREITKAVYVWLDTIGSPGEPAWIVSLDELDERGRAESTHTKWVCEVETDDDGEIIESSSEEAEAEATAWAVQYAAGEGLPVFANPPDGPASQILSAAEAEVAAYIASHNDDDEHDDDELRRLFALAFEREPDADDLAEGLWSHLVAFAGEYGRG